MNSKKIIATAVMALLAGGTVAAQGHMKSYSYVEAQGGVQMTSTNAKMTKLLTSRLSSAPVCTLTDRRQRAASPILTSTTSGTM